MIFDIVYLGNPITVEIAPSESLLMHTWTEKNTYLGVPLDNSTTVHCPNVGCHLCPFDLETKIDRQGVGCSTVPNTDKVLGLIKYHGMTDITTTNPELFI